MISKTNNNMSAVMKSDKDDNEWWDAEVIRETCENFYGIQIPKEEFQARVTQALEKGYLEKSPEGLLRCTEAAAESLSLLMYLQDLDDEEFFDA